MPVAIAITKASTDADNVDRFTIAGPGQSPTKPQPTPNSSALASYSRANRKRNELPITDTELRLMAAAATIGFNNRPNAG